MRSINAKPNLIQYLGSDTAINILIWISVLGFVLYFCCMFIYPAVSLGFDRALFVSTLERWQALNAGVLAFIASIIAFSAVHHRTAMERKNKYAAAKAFLPAALSELTLYLRRSASVYTEAWGESSTEELISQKTLKIQIPNLPEEYKETFTRCIEFGKPNVVECLVKILEKLQIHHARLYDLSNWLSPNSQNIVVKENIRSDLCYAADIQICINSLFLYARGQAEFKPKSVVCQDYRNAFASMDLDIEHFDGLEKCVRRRLDSDEEQP